MFLLFDLMVLYLQPKYYNDTIMKEFLKKHWAKISAAITAAVIAFLTALMASCASTQKILIEQQHGEDVQKTIIESNTQVEQLNFQIRTTWP